MLQKLINHSPDLKRLRDEGYEIEVRGGYLLIHHIPYVNSNREIKYGILVTELSRNGSVTLPPSTHVIQFVGDHPCNKDGSLITAIQHGSQNQVCEGVTTNHSFSNKPAGGYPDYYHKISRYEGVISAPAKAIDDSVTAKTFKPCISGEEDPIFNYTDTNTSRANIYAMNAKFKGQKIAIIGLGGTGSYVLDFVSKTPVDQIHLFDSDIFHQHNAFRSPGAASLTDLENMFSKVNYCAKIYSNMHKGIVPHEERINHTNLSELDSMSFVFICIDKNEVKKGIIKYLLQKGIPFVDVGLGVNVVDDTLIGTIRVTSATSEKSDHIASRISFVDDENNDYNTNIQIAELNALNASLAVIKWKKLTGFYHDLEEEHHCTFTLNTAQLINEDSTFEA